MKKWIRLVVLLSTTGRALTTSPAWADDGERMAMARVRLSTDAAIATGCIRVGQVIDDSVKDLRRKIVRAGGDTAIVWFGADEMHAQVFRCPSTAAPPAPPVPPNIPPPPPGVPPPPPPGLSR